MQVSDVRTVIRTDRYGALPVTTENKENASQDFDPTGLSPEEVAMLNGGDEDENSEDQGEIVSEETTGPEDGEVQTEEGESTGKPPKGFVPHAALHQTRLQLKEANERLQEYQRFQQEIASKLASAAAQQQAPQKQQVEQQEDPNAIPNEDEDPMGFIKWAKKQLLDRQEQDQRVRQMSEQEQRIQEFRVDVAREFDTQAAADPDAQEGFSFLQAALKHEWDTVHAPIGKVPFEQFQSAIIMQHAQYARANRIPIAKYVKNLAAARGWQPGLLAQLQQKHATPSNDGLSKQMEQVEKVAKAQNVNVSLGKSSSGDSELTLESLAKMSGAQLEKLAAKNPALFEKLTGIK
jgi:hypothetical protein